MNIKITKGDVIWNWIGIIVSLCSNFVMIPFLLHYLTTETYGLWNVFVSLGSISVLFDFGFNGMFARNVSYCWGGVDHLQKDGVVEAQQDAKINFLLLGKVIKTCQVIYFLISILALTGLVSIGTYYITIVSEEILSSQIIIAWILYSIAIFLNLFYGYYDAFLRGIGEIGKVNKFRTVAKVAQIIMTIVLLMTGFDMIGVSLAYIVYGIIFFVLCKKAFFSKEEIKNNLDRRNRIAKNDLLEIFGIVWHNAWKDGIVSIANYVSNQVTTILCSLYLGLAATGEFGLIVQLFSAVAQIASSLFNVYQPSLQEAYARRNFKYSRKVVSFSIVSYVALYILGSLGVIVVVIPILRYIRPQMGFALGILMLISFYQGILKYRDCYACYLAGTNRLIYYKSFLISAALCLLLSLLTLKFTHMGLYGLAIAQIVSQIVFNTWYWPKKVDKELDITAKSKVCLSIEVLKKRNI